MLHFLLRASQVLLVLKKKKKNLPASAGDTRDKNSDHWEDPLE